MELKKYKLGDLCMEGHIGIYGIPAPAIDYDSTKTRYLRISDIGDDGNITNNDKKSVEADDLEKYIMQENDMVFARTGNSTGRAYLYDPKDGELAFAGFLIRYRLNPQKINPKYVRYFTQSSYYRQWVENLSVGSTRGNISAQTFADCPIVAPSKCQQDILVKLLSSIDCKIALNRQINDNLESMAKQLYDYWFVQFDFPNEDGKPYKSSGGAMEWNERLKREIPTCFDVAKLGKLCNFRNGINYGKDEKGNEYKIVNVRNISSSRILLDGEDFDTITVPTSKAENYILKPNDIIIARSGCPGETRILSSPANTLFCGFIICCSPNESRMRNYLTYCLKQVEGTNATTSGGSILQNVSQDTLKGLLVIVPGKKMIDKFNQTIELLFARMLNCLKENKELIKRRDELLPLLMNGQATVENLG